MRIDDDWLCLWIQFSENQKHFLFYSSPRLLSFCYQQNRKITTRTTPGFLSPPAPPLGPSLSLSIRIATAKNLLFCSPLNCWRLFFLYSSSQPRSTIFFLSLMGQVEKHAVRKSSERAFHEQSVDEFIRLLLLLLFNFFFFLPLY